VAARAPSRRARSRVNAPGSHVVRSGTNDRG
jgi:hypothetical protein